MFHLDSSLCVESQKGLLRAFSAQSQLRSHGFLYNRGVCSCVLQCIHFLLLSLVGFRTSTAITPKRAFHRICEGISAEAVRIYDDCTSFAFKDRLFPLADVHRSIPS